MIGLHSNARRWLSAHELTLGAAIVPLGLATWLGIAAPYGAVNLQWPVVALMLAVVVQALLGSRAGAPVGATVVALLAIPVLGMLFPLYELFAAFLTFRLAFVLAVIWATVLYLCLPALESLRHPYGWWAPAAAFLLAAIGFTGGFATAGSSPDRPAPSSLVYAYEHGSGAALWATSVQADDADAEATAWAVSRAGSTFDDTRDLSPFGYRAGNAAVTEAPVTTALPPDVVFASDTLEGSVRKARIEVRSRIGSEMIGFHPDEGGRTRIRSVNGISIEEPEAIAWIEHWGVPEDAVVLEVEGPAQDPIELTVVEHLLRPEEILGEEAFTRPADLAPDEPAMSDRAMFRFSIASFADPRHGVMLPGDSTETPPPDSPATDTTAAAPDAEPDADAAADTTTAEPAGPDSARVDTTSAAEAADTLAAPDSLTTVDTITTSAGPPPPDTVRLPPRLR